ncbi:MAG: DUF4177 domain-containing protein [Nitrospiraceae bacterium]
MTKNETPRWRYKFVLSERFKTGLWHAIAMDDVNIDPRVMSDVLNELGEDGWELVAVVPIGETALMHDALLKHILKKREEH